MKRLSADPGSDRTAEAVAQRCVAAVDLLLGVSRSQSFAHGPSGWEHAVAYVLGEVVLAWVARLDGSFPPDLVRDGRLFDLGRESPAAWRRAPVSDRLHEWIAGPTAEPVRYEELSAESLGFIYERVLSTRTDDSSGLGGHRKRSGSFFTPSILAEEVVEQALAPCLARLGENPAFAVCDPAMGAGAFLIAALRKLVHARLEPARAKATNFAEAADAAAALRLARACLYGADVSPLAVAVAEASLFLLVGDSAHPPRQLGEHLVVADALFEDPPRPQGGDFDAVIGNPPWVAYAGRAAQRLDPERRAALSRRYTAWRGYPTLHGLFVERAVELAPRGVVALLLPSPVADLDGYRAVRRAATRSHRAREPLKEYGQDAFANVTQPCFALILDPDTKATASDQPWGLAERQHARATCGEVPLPDALTRLREAAPFPRELFGELGFQSNRQVSEQLFLRAPAPDARHRYPLLEGRDVQEYRQGPPRLFLNPDPTVLKRTRCRLRAPSDYERARFVVRQTAMVPIAALHGGLPFRNSLLAGFEFEALRPELVVALLNSALYRSLHLASRRDARQAAFPQVKVAHLRALPRPKAGAPRLDDVMELSLRATRARGVDAELRGAIDEAVFDIFEIPRSERDGVYRFLEDRAPRFGHRIPREAIP